MEKVASYKSDSGAFHETEHPAWLDDLNHWLKSKGLDNHGVRSQISDAIVADLRNGNHLITIMEGIKRTMEPPPPIAATFDDMVQRAICA